MSPTRLVAVALILACTQSDGRAADAPFPTTWIGYTELRTDLPGGRHANVRTMRAALVQADGTARRLLADELADAPDAWTQFAGWSPDGTTAVVGRGWQNPDNARWEENHKQFDSPSKAGSTTRTS